MYCSNCGKKNDTDAKFCISCGAELSLHPAKQHATTDVKEDEAVQELLPNIEYWSLSPLRVYLLSILTFDLFTIVWFGCQWAAVQSATKWKISPAWRGIFNIFFAYNLFKYAKQSAEAHGYEKSISVQQLSLVYIVFLFACEIAGKFTGFLGTIFFCIFAFVNPLAFVVIQKAMNFNNSKVVAGYVPKKPFTWIDALLVILVVIVYALILVGGIYGTSS